MKFCRQYQPVNEGVLIHGISQELSKKIQRKSNLSGSNGRRRSKSENRKIKWRKFWVLEDADRGLFVSEKFVLASLRGEPRIHDEGRMEYS